MGKGWAGTKTLEKTGLAPGENTGRDSGRGGAGPGILVKSGMMLGLGETKDGVLKSLRDLREHGRLARGMGFTHVASAPLVRSSYLAEEALLGRKGN